MPCGPIKLQGFGALVCMRTDHSIRDKRWRLLSVRQLTSGGRADFPFLLRTVFPWCHWSREEQGQGTGNWHRAEQTRAGQSGCRGAWPQGCLTAALHHTGAALCYMKFSSLHPKLGILLGIGTNSCRTLVNPRHSLVISRFQTDAAAQGRGREHGAERRRPPPRLSALRRAGA